MAPRTPTPAPGPALEKTGWKWAYDKLTRDVHLYRSGRRAIPLASPEGRKLVARRCGVGIRSRQIDDLIAQAEDHALASGSAVTVAHSTHIDRETRTAYVSIGDGWMVVLNPERPVRAAVGYDAVVLLDDPGFQSLGYDDLKAANGSASMALDSLRRVLLDQQPPGAGSLTREEMAATLLSWWLGIFLRSAATARPLLTLYGGPGSGKTVTARLLGTAYYGRSFDVSGTASGSRALKDLAAAMATRTLTARDDVNSAPDGIMDLLCRAATGARFDLSAYYETLALKSYDLRAALALTAHQPEWALRRDVLSRLLVLRYAKPDPTRVTEGERVRAVLAARPAIWMETFRLLQAGLADTKVPLPVTRFGDWESIARRALRGASMEDDLDRALRKMKDERMAVALAADPFLGMLRGLSMCDGMSDKWFTAAELIDEIARYAGTREHEHDPHRATYSIRNPRSLAQMLSRVERDGSMVIEVRRKFGHNSIARWNIRPR